jgi:hypothetical protein
MVAGQGGLSKEFVWAAKKVRHLRYMLISMSISGGLRLVRGKPGAFYGQAAFA